MWLDKVAWKIYDDSPVIEFVCLPKVKLLLNWIMSIINIRFQFIEKRFSFKQLFSIKQFVLLLSFDTQIDITINMFSLLLNLEVCKFFKNDYAKV